MYANTNKCVREPKENSDFNINEEVNSEQKHRINNSESRNVGKASEDSGRNEIIEEDKCVKNTSCYEYMQKPRVNDANTQVDISSVPAQVYVPKFHNSNPTRNTNVNKIYFLIISNVFRTTMGSCFWC